VLSIVRWLCSKSQPRDAATIALWLIYDTFRTVKHNPDFPEEIRHQLLANCASIGMAALTGIEGLLPFFRPPPPSPASKVSSLTTSTLSPTPPLSSDSPPLRAFLFESKRPEELHEQWFVPCFVRNKKTDKQVLAIREIVREFEQQQLGQLHSKTSAKRDERITAIAEGLAKNDELKQAKKVNFTKEFFRDTEKSETETKRDMSLQVFRETSRRQDAARRWKSVIRSVAHPRGCWSYACGRAMYPTRKHDEAERPELVAVGPLYKLDPYETPSHKRPFLKIDFTGSCAPRLQRAPNAPKSSREGAPQASDLSSKIAPKHGDSAPTLA
jgi:hypothetical protein